MRTILYLPGTSLTSQGPVVYHAGAGGGSYEFRWSPRFNRHILGGEPLTAAELDRVAVDLFSADRPSRHPIPQMVADAPPPPVVAAATEESLFEEAVRIAADPTSLERLGFRIVGRARKLRAEQAKAQAATTAPTP